MAWSGGGALSMAVASIQWHGTEAESEALSVAVQENCGCTFGMMGIRLTLCDAHDMLINDQRALNGLVYMRRWLAAVQPNAGKREIRP